MISGNAYEEIYEILGYMDKIAVMKVPENILKNIKRRRNPNFRTKIEKDNIFNEKNISKEAVDILCWLDYTYWMSKERKLEIDRIKYKKINESEEKKRKLYNPENIFKNNNEDEDKKNNIFEKSLVIVEEKSILKKILNIIKNMFKLK